MTTRVALIGGGVIGAGWAECCRAAGVEVCVFDPSPGTAESLRGVTLAGSIADAVRDADFVQENGPEREDVKAEIIRAIDLAARPEVVVASSSSTMMPSTLAAMAPEHPERVLVGHPFNPVHLMPLVEVVGGSATAAVAIEDAMAFYRRFGKRPVHLRREVPGHLANRLQAALWREAYSLVESGVASVADVDAAIAHGPGLRWALLGPLVNQHLSGGAGGLAHVLAHLGPPTQQIMDDLGAPRLTPDLVDVLVSGVDDELAGIDQTALIARRDQLLIDLLAAKAAASELP